MDIGVVMYCDAFQTGEMAIEAQRFAAAYCHAHEHTEMVLDPGRVEIMGIPDIR